MGEKKKFDLKSNIIFLSLISYYYSNDYVDDNSATLTSQRDTKSTIEITPSQFPSLKVRVRKDVL
ncbi:MAG: hypothetical protein BMS9Abin21_227 [Thermodesulfovibrionia bacterium]|nr:MAG: hypothetical protein BMS9Abin21_227 [Thermodesulfovibrionia bacterium]